MTIKRRAFITGAGAAAASTAFADTFGVAAPADGNARNVATSAAGHDFNSLYRGEYLNYVAFPLGGVGAGMICLEGSGALTQFSLHNHPDLKNEPLVFAALAVSGEQKIARVLEGPIPAWKIYPDGRGDTGHGGLPRFPNTTFEAQFPFAKVNLIDDQFPIQIEITGWSPFEAGDADNSSLPVAALEYTFTNSGGSPREAVFSFNVANFITMAGAGGLFVRARSNSTIEPTPGGFILNGGTDPARLWECGSFAAWVDDPTVKVNHAWYRGGWTDALAMAWHDVQEATCYERAPINDGKTPQGASLFVPFLLAPGDAKKIKLRLAWYSGRSNLRLGGGQGSDLLNDGEETYRPWYAGRFIDIHALIAYWHRQYEPLKQKAQRFSKCFYDSTLPPEVLEAVAANLSILKSPTVLRQTDGKLWGWEGVTDSVGAFPGSCTHVWNYAQAIPHLFPGLERSLRETEFTINQNQEGHQVFRAAIPIRPTEDVYKRFFAAADGQLGGIMKVHREWRISGNTAWLRGLWPKVRASLDYAIHTWDPRHRGWLEEPQHTTYDKSFWGPNSMCTSIYLGALKAATLMGKSLNDDISLYATLIDNGVGRVETQLFDGEYFHQKIEWRDLSAKYPVDTEWLRFEHEYGGLEVFFDTPEALALADKEGPPYQYGKGCLSDGVLGVWMALVCGVNDVMDSRKVRSHLKAVHRYNFKQDLSQHTNLFRSSLACGTEGGLLLCTWPKGAALTLPMLYSAEVWTGIEYQAASHMIAMGMVSEGLDIVRTTRQRYDGRVRNPFDEIEAGRWYARAMSSYALLQACSGARFDAVDKILYLKPGIHGDFRCFLSTATGYGTVGVRDGKPFVEIVSGAIPFKSIQYTAASFGPR